MADKIDFKDTMTAAIASGAAVAAADPANNVTKADIPDVVAAATKAAAPIIKEAQAHYDFATNNESLQTSYSFTGGLIGFLGGIGIITERLWDGYMPADDNTALIPALAAVIGPLWVLYGRLGRSKPIGQ